MKRTTISDVAKHCGVSTMTVSRVVNGIQNVKEETRKRVEAAVAELGYRPDPTLRALRASYHRSFGDKSRQHHATMAYLDFDCDEFSLDIFEKAGMAASPLGYDLKYHKFPTDEKEQRQLSRRLWMQGIYGLLFGVTKGERNIGGFQMEKFAMVSIGAFHHTPPIDTVGVDYFQALYLAASKCHEQGARRIALCTAGRDVYTGHRWLGAYHAFCQRHKLEPIQNDILGYDDRSVDWARRQKVDAIIGLQGIRRIQAKLPKVNVVCLNDWLTAFEREHLSPFDIQHVYVPRELIAKEAVSLLDFNLIHRRYGVPSWPRHIFIQAKWRTRLPLETSSAALQ